MKKSLTADDIAQAVQGRLEGDPQRTIDGAAGLEEATERQVSFFHHLKYLGALERTRAGVVLIASDAGGVSFSKNRTVIRVENPQRAFAQVLRLLDAGRQKHPRGVHAQALIDPAASVAPDASIGAFTVVEAGATVHARAIIYSGCYIGVDCQVGEDALLYPHVTLREDTQLGKRVIIHSGAVLGSDGYGFVTKEGRHEKIPQIGRVVVEDDVELGANVAVDRATTGETRIGAGTKVDNLVHIAHNVQIGRDCLIVAQVGISGSTRVGKGVTLAGQVGIAGHLKIGDGAVIAAQSGVINGVAPGEVLFGSPARPHRQAMKIQALLGKLPEMYDALKAARKKAVPQP